MQCTTLGQLRHGCEERVSAACTASSVLQAGPREAAGTKEESCLPPAEPAVSGAEHQHPATKGTGTVAFLGVTAESLCVAVCMQTIEYDQYPCFR